MNVHKSDIIDAIGIDRESDWVVLTLVDAEPWNVSYQDHLRLLQDKINKYLQFIEQGELANTYPAAKNKSIKIDIVFKHVPNDQAKECLRNAKLAVEKAGYLLSYQIYE